MPNLIKQTLLVFCATIFLSGSVNATAQIHQTCPNMSHTNFIPPSWKFIVYRALPQSHNLLTNVTWNTEAGIVCNYNLPDTGTFFQLSHPLYKPHTFGKSHWISSNAANQACDLSTDNTCKCRGNALEDCRIIEND